MEQNQSLAIIDRPDTRTRFINIFKGVHHVDETRSSEMLEVERWNFERGLTEKGIGADVTQLSLMGVFLDVVSNGMSFSEQSKHVYIMTRSVKTGRKDEKGKDVYEKRLVYSVSPDGKIFLAQRSGAIEYVSKPMFVYEGDDFAPYTDEKGNQVVMHKPKFPRNPAAKIQAGYVFVVYKGGKREPFWMDINDIERLKKYSARNNRKWVNGGWQDGEPNALYSAGPGNSIDTGFFGAKLISHALKNVRKNRVPTMNEVEDDIADTPYAVVDAPVMQIDRPSPEFVPDPPSPETNDFNPNESF